MPGFDGTGPNGEGPMTGRGAGRCNRAFECRQRRGFRRCGFGRFSTQETISRQERLEILKANKKQIEDEILSIENEQDL